MKIFLWLLIFLSLPAQAQYAHRQNPGVAGGTAPTIAALGACPGTGCVSLNTSGTSVMMATIVAGAGCPGANCTLQFACTKDNWATSSVVAADLFSNGSLVGAPATTTTVAGVFIMPTYSFPLCGVLASIYASGTATVSLDADPAFLPAIGATGAAAQQVEGTAAAGAAALGNPVYTGGLGFNGVVAPARYCDKTALLTTLGTTATVQQISAQTSQKIYICGYASLASTAVAGVTLTWTEGTGANCVTGQTNATPALFTTPTSAPTTANFVLGPFGGGALAWTSTAGDALCLTQSSTANSTAVSGVIWYTQN